MARLSAESRRGRARSMAVALIASFLVVGASAAPVLAGDPPPPLEPIDPQVVTQAADQTWADYHEIPGSPYADPTIEPTVERFNVALILTDFPDTPFVVTQPQGSTVFGNPGPLAMAWGRKVSAAPAATSPTAVSTCSTSIAASIFSPLRWARSKIWRRVGSRQPANAS